MRTVIVYCSTLLFALVLSRTLVAQTNNSYPMLMHLNPVAAQVGQTSEHELSARYNLAGASQVMISGNGVTGEVLPNEQEKPEDKSRHDIMASKCKLRIQVASDALPGVRDLRVMTPHGISTLGQLVITREPIVRESADNDTPDKAVEFTVPAALCGIIEKGEDVDHYKFNVAAGAALTFHVRSQRLLNRLHDMQTRVDPMITLRNDAGVTLAASDNHYAGDPLLHYVFAQAGTYRLDVRDVRYQGNADWVYVVEVMQRPFVTQSFPTALAAGQETNLQLVGLNLPAEATTKITIPAGTAAGIQWVSPPVADQAVNAWPVLVTDLPVINELPSQPVPAQPDPAQADPAASTNNAGVTKAVAQQLTLPCTVVGRIERNDEVDRYRFTAKANEKLTFEVTARRCDSGVDPYFRILNEQGGQLAEVDDSNFLRMTSSDGILENWNVPADGTYELEIRDLHQRGGAEFPYACSIRPAEPMFLLEADTDKTPLAPGMSGVVYVKAVRKNGFNGPIQLEAACDLPGLKIVAGDIPADVADGCIWLEAASDAPIGAAQLAIKGTGKMTLPDGTERTLQASADVYQEYYSPGGGRGHYPVQWHTVSIAGPMDIKSIKLSTSEIVLKPGESQKIEVTVERSPEYKGNVTLDMMLQHLEQPYGNPLPKGVKVDVGASKTLLPAGESQGFITLKAADDAPAVEKHLMTVNAHVSINFVMKHTLCGPPVYISVRK